MCEAIDTSIHYYYCSRYIDNNDSRQIAEVERKQPKKIMPQKIMRPAGIEPTIFRTGVAV